MSDPTYGGQGAAGGGAEPPKGRGGVVTAIVIGSLALIAAIVAIVLVLTRGDDDAEASPSPTPSESPSPSETPTSAQPSPDPDETDSAQGGSGTQGDPFLLGQEFLFEGAVVGAPTDATWNVVISGVEPVPQLTAEGPCFVVFGTMTPLTWPGDVPTGEDVPYTDFWMDDGSVPNYAEDGQCDVSGYTDGRYSTGVGWDTFNPVELPTGDGPFEFWEAWWIGDYDGGAVQWVPVGYYGYNEDLAYYVSGTDSLE